MQKVVVCNFSTAESKLNPLMEEGWTVVGETFRTVSSTVMIPEKDRVDHGPAYRTVNVVVVVLEKF
jgi:hypothetical protein